MPSSTPSIRQTRNSSRNSQKFQQFAEKSQKTTAQRPNKQKLAEIGVILDEKPDKPMEKPKFITSRLIVKNLPKHLTEERFKQHFQQKGTVTDAKLMKTRDGISRRFGYIGYKTEKEALDALEYFHNSFIDTSKIEIEMARPSGDKDTARPWSKYSQGSSAHDRYLQSKMDAAEKERLKKKEREEKLKQNRENLQKEMEKKRAMLVDIFGQGVNVDDPKLKEYLEVMQPRSNKRTWTNDSVNPDQDQGILGGLKKQEEKLKKAEAKLQAKIKSDVVAVPNKKPGGEGLMVSKVHVKFDDSSDDEYQDLPGKSVEASEGEQDLEDLDELDEEEIEEAEKEVEDQVEEELDEDEAALEQVQEQVREETVAAPKQLLEDVYIPIRDAKEKKKKPVADKSLNMDLIAETGRLFVRNLAYTCTDEDLQKFFGKYGPISEVHIPIDKESKQPKGFAFVQYLMPENAVKAFLDANGKIFQGRIVDIIPGKGKIVIEENVNEKSSFKKKQAQKIKEQVASGQGFWNSLFMNRDAVVESMAKRLGVGKSEILNPEADNVAVRMALAETQIINETKEFLKDHGVDLDQFEKDKARSNVTLLIKNIPYTTEESELRDLFGKHGDLGRVLVTPSKTLALVEFLHPNEAKAAYRHLSYSKFKHLPLFLEWAPATTFSKPFDPSEVKKVETVEEVELPEMEGGTGFTVFVKNLNFNTTKETLETIFNAITNDPNGIRSVTIATKPDPKHKGQTLSMGFGFVEFAHKEDVEKALKTMQGVVVDGHAIQLKLSQRASTSTKKAKSTTGVAMVTENDIPSTKLAIRNIPFEANRKELRQLFAQFGNVKSLRLPKKFDGSHRGFGFVDFLTKHDAKNAMTTLAGTHFYGRHLVLEWAKDDEGDEDLMETEVDALRKKTQVSIRDVKRRGDEEESTSKRRKIVVSKIDEDSD